MTGGGAMSYREEILALAGHLTGDYVPYYPRLAKLAGGVKAAVLLSRLVSWTGVFVRARDPRHADGWLWKTRDALREETGLSRREQEAAREKLKSLGLLQEQLRGLPATMHFRVDLDRLGTLLGQQIGRPYHAWRWDDRRFLDDFLGRYRVVYRRLALACESLTAAIHLSSLLLATRKRLLAPDATSLSEWDGWMTLEHRPCKALGLSPKGLARARHGLVELGVIEERRERKLNPKVQTRLLPGPLMALVKDHHPLSWASKTACCDESVSPDVRIDELLNSQNVPTGIPKTCQLDFPECTNWNSQNEPTGMALLGTPQIVPEAAPMLALSAPLACARKDFPINKPLLPPQPPYETEAVVCGGREFEISPREPLEAQAPQGQQGGGLIYPGQMLQTEQAMALRLLQPVPVDQRQLVLDELAGQLTAKGSEGVRNPLGYLARLAQRAAEGGFIPTLALGVARRREALREEAERRREENQARRAARYDRQASRARLAEVMAAAGLR